MVRVLSFSVLLFATLFADVLSILPIQPWLAHCDDTGINRIHASSAYWVLISPSSSSSPFTFIISLCNRTNSTPIGMSVCADSTLYFAAVWDGNGTCLQSYNSPLAVDGNGTTGDPLIVQFQSNVTGKRLSLQLACNSSRNFAITSVEELTPSLMAVQGQVSDLCPSGGSSSSNGSSNGSEIVPSDETNSHRTMIAIMVVFVVLGVVAASVLYRRRQISRHSPYQPIAQDGDGADLQANNVQDS